MLENDDIAKPNESTNALKTLVISKPLDSLNKEPRIVSM